MKVLGIDTSTEVTTVGLWSPEDGVIGLSQIKRQGSHAESALPALDHVLELSDTGLDEVGLIVVTKGPGSFTGLRIGMTMAKTLAQVLRIPIVGVSTLEVMAFAADDEDRLIVPLLDARRKRVYTAAFRWERQRLHRIENDQVKTLEELREDYRGQDVIFCGPSTALIAEDKERQWKLLPDYWTAMNGLHVAYVGYCQWKMGELDHYKTLVPDYLNLSQAERERQKKNEREH